ncbi:MAG: hypothetical protein K6E49_02360 [Lachnospiraceae bacterium]|nr:hypothetical protein [Lachnospiraceae bacterium]
MYRPAIVVIAYDRPKALRRLLDSIESASYPEGISPVLVISIDRSDSDDVVNMAKGFEYTHGKKVIIARSERMGLRAHVLACGDLTEEYGSIIVLEDDLFVAPCFYEYACAALDFSDNDERIGAVSLYDHRFNVHKRESFVAADDGFDNYYLQLASSWGQAYTKKQWDSFKTWYRDNRDKDLADPFVPANVSGWSDRSWLKYYIVYLIETDKYCLYPRKSLTTNFGDIGSHAEKTDTDLQVPMAGSKHCRCDFSGLDTSHAVYDSFFELVGCYKEDRICLGDYDGSRKSTDAGLIVDLYGLKPVTDQIAKANDTPGAVKIRYVLSAVPLPFKVIKSFGRQMRPVDANIRFQVAGNDLYLYDVTAAGNPPKTGKKALRLFYEYRGISSKSMVEMIKYRIFEKIFKNYGR